MKRNPATPSTAHRMVRYAWRIFAGGEITTRWMRERFGLSKMTANRDMNELIAALPVKLDQPRKKGVPRKVSLQRVIVRNFAESNE